jgi:tetratricopeptide (TPR) repeat protein
MNRPREAAELAAREVAGAPSSAHAWTILARCYAAMEQPAQALEAANRAVGLDPSDPEPHLIASKALQKLGGTAQAIRAAEEVLRLAPLHPAAHANLATALTSRPLGETFFGLFMPRAYRRATEHAAKAIALAPAATTGHFAAGLVAMRSRRPRQARIHFQRVLQLDPQNAAALNNLAVLDVGRGRVSKGTARYAQAIATEPTMGLARQNARATVHMVAFAFHAFGWLIYFCFSGIMTGSQTGPLAFSWTTRSSVALALSLAYAISVVGAYLRLDPRVRAFGRRLVTGSWIRKAVLVLDTAIFACFAISTTSHGVLAADTYGIGMLLIVLSWVGFAVAGRR